MSGPTLGLVHRYVVPSAAHVAARAARLLLLHGVGGDENDLLPLGQMMRPGAALLSGRGTVLDRGAPRFFRWVSEHVLDHMHLPRRIGELADFVASAADAYRQCWHDLRRGPLGRVERRSSFW